MARPVGIKETQPRKQMATRGSTDGQGYILPDSGCRIATKYLGHASLCLECPYPECKSTNRKPYKEI